MRESAFQSSLIREIKTRWPGAMVLKNDPDYIQGIPDLLVLWEGHWAALETKRSGNANRQENQEWYIAKMRRMSYASFIDPENKEGVLYEMECAFKS